MREIYEPAEGSLGALVLNYLRNRPDVLELSQQQIADLFPPTKFASVPGCLMTPMQHGLLARVRNGAGVLVYRRGHKLNGAAAASAEAPAASAAPPAPAPTPAPTAPGAALQGIRFGRELSAAAAESSTKPAGRPGPANGSPVQRLPAIDIAALQVRTDRPLPVPQAPKRQSRYDAIFDKLTEVGASTLLPRSYLGALKQAALKYSKRTRRRVMAYALPDDPEHCGVWRLPDPESQGATKPSNTTRSAA